MSVRMTTHPAHNQQLLRVGKHGVVDVSVATSTLGAAGQRHNLHRRGTNTSTRGN